MLIERKKLLISDLDDTLIVTTSLYETRRDAMLGEAAAAAGMDPGEVREIFEAINARKEAAGKLKVTDWLTSIRETIRALPIAEEVSAEISRKWTSSVLELEQSIYPALRGSIEGVAIMKSMGYDLALYTLGDPNLQMGQKIVPHGLLEYFDTINIFPHRKGLAEMRQVLEKHGVLPEDAVVVGDSMRNDIGPALELGCSAILIRHALTEPYTRATAARYGYEPHAVVSDWSVVPTLADALLSERRQARESVSRRAGRRLQR